MPSDGIGTGGHALGADFGTSHTVAVVRWPDGRARPLLIDGSPLLPSAVYADPAGALVAGRDAIHSARLDPARFEPNPKRRINDGTVLLGEREVPVVELVRAVLARVAEEWRRTVGDIVPTVTLTCPAAWGATRRQVLADAAARAGLGRTRLVAEPVAAATYFAQVLGRDVPIGSVVVVHDFGAGTFDASVVARKAGGFEVLAVDGRDDLGGIDVDAALIAHLRKQYQERDPAAWARLDAPATVEDRRAKQQLWDDVRVAKERLSRSQRADLVIPLLDLAVHLTREELEAQAEPLLDQAVRVTQAVMRWTQLAEGRVAGVFLVGGSSRIPLMATLLHRALGTALVVIEQPELVVAEGSVLSATALLASAPAAPGPTGMMPAVPGSVGRREMTPPPGTPAPVGFGSTPGVPGSPGVPGPQVASGASAVAGSPVGPGSPGAGLADPARAVLASQTSPAAAGAVGTPTAPVSPATGRSIGRVIVPGAQPPGRAAGSAPVAPTRQMPRVERPPTPPSGPPAAPASPAAPGPAPQRPPRPAGPAQTRVAPPPHQPAAPYPVAAPRPAPYADLPRRPSRVRRAIVMLFILLFLLAVPIVAGLLAYRFARDGGWPF